MTTSGVTLRRAKTPLVAAPHWEHNRLWPSLDPGNKTAESRARDVTVVGDNWGENTVSLTEQKKSVSWKIYMSSSCGCLTHSASAAICMRAGLGVLRLTVAVFLTKNPNLTLSKFWPAAPAEMRNSPLPTNGSFRQEIYVKKTLQHSPGKDVYISLCLQHSKPKKTKNPFYP